jgi:hypothetical protein
MPSPLHGLLRTRALPDQCDHDQNGMVWLLAYLQQGTHNERSKWLFAYCYNE